jgi:hypothetical protein
VCSDLGRPPPARSSVEDHAADADAAAFEITNRKNQWIDRPLFERGNPAHARAIGVAYFRRREFELINATGSCVGDPELKAKRLIRIAGSGGSARGPTT